ncbi:MAG: hypothetical protein IJZ59_07020, partial [Alphaproteobacteria bacterium]|nr:hypothetical protein [Alphaproteobacteria bacterium]
MKYNAFPILLATTFLSTPAVTQTVPEINADYLNSLTGEKVTWEEETASREDTVQIGDKFYKYTYHKPSTYTETSTNVSTMISDITNVVFNSSGISLSSNDYSSFNIMADFLGGRGGFAINVAYGAKVGAINGVFINCHGVLNLYNGANVNNITGNFIDNFVSSSGGVISVSQGSNVNNIAGNFIYNHAAKYGGAVYFSEDSYVYSYLNLNNTIQGNFLNNWVEIYSGSNLALGGAIYKYANRYIGTGQYAYIDTKFSSDSGVLFFTENYTKDLIRGKIYNAIFLSSVYKESGVTSFNTSNNGAWVINDNIEGGNNTNTSISYINNSYKLYFIGNDTIDTELGTTTQYINMNNAIINAGEVKVENTTLRFGNYQHEDKTAKNWNGKGKFIASLNSDGTENLKADSVTSLTLNNAVFDISNGYLETIKLKKLTSTENTSNFIHLDVNVEKMESDIINVKGDVDGGTKLIIHATSDKDIRGRGKILFAESFGDTKGGETSFEVARVYKSPYLYDVIYEGVKNTSTPTESKDNTWYFEMNDKENPNKEQDPVDPNPDVPNIDDNIPTRPLSPIEIAPEIIGFEAVTSAGLAQTNGMVYNIMRKVGISKLYCKGCGFYDYNWDGKPFHNAWVDTTYNGLTIEAPVEIEAKVWGIEAGSDIQHDLNNKLGIFVSYRQGNYEMDGKGEKYYSTIGSEIDIDSYLAGLYYRYDHNNWYAFATAYAGM